MARLGKDTGTRARALAELLSPARLTEIVDVGSNPMNVPDYADLAATGLTRITGFEPQESAYAQLRERESATERHLPYAVGNGEIGTYRLCRSAGMGSLLEPDRTACDYLGRWHRAFTVLERIEMPTRRLDDIAEIERMDLLKIDIQGGELEVFRHGRARLETAVAVMTEVAFIPLYEDQPLLDAQMAELRDQGFILHKFAFAKQVSLAAGDELPLPRGQKSSQLVDGDAIFIRDLRDPARYGDEDLKHLALLADTVFGSPDLTMRCLKHLTERGAVGQDAVALYGALYAREPA